MSDSLACPSCGVRLRIAASKKVFRGKCPKCGSVVERKAAVPELEPSGVSFHPAQQPVDEPDNEPEPLELPARSQKSPAEVMRKLLAGFTGTVPRRGPGFGYLFALLLTAMVIVVLILAYLILVAAVAYGVYWYATTIATLPLARMGRAIVLIWAFHLAVIVSGGMLVISMILPIIPRRRGRMEGKRLTPGDAPILHSFAAKIAESLGAPPPSEIRLTLDVNASACQIGLFRRRLILSIGAPLIAGMNAQQLGAIIAHELGHFSQRGGSGLRNFVNSFVIWCAMAAGYQQSFADDVFDRSEADTAIEMILAWVTWFVQLLGSLAVMGLAWLGLLATMFVSRRQEYDADRYEAAFAGSDAFFGTTRRLIELTLGQQMILSRGFSYVGSVLKDFDGVGNYAAEVVAAADALAEHSKEVVEHDLQAPTGWLSSHPGNRSRIAAVRARPQPGIFHLKMPGYRLYPRLNPHGAS
jgi:Zn-dependent protease with chaperone function